ncbi:MAG: glycosyltransferase family 4 protein, partial [Chloroflexi bacterium]|nr:glycosyltransferase family 4 protein [Chloroflexota bacterium]
MKVLFVACQDSPFDHNAGSGKDYEIYQGLVRNGAEVVVVGPFPFSQTFAERIFRKAHTLLIKRRPAKYPDSFLNKAAAEVKKNIRTHKPDVIFSKYLSILCRIKTEVPIVVLSDTTLAGNQREWPIFTRAAFLKQNRCKQKGYDLAHSIFVHSQWSVDDLVHSYHQPLSKIHLNACPASIPTDVIPATITPKDLSPLKILIVGREYRRKGIDIAIEVIRQLNRQGTDACLRIVGMNGESDEQVQYMGLYNKTIPEQLQGYVANYQWANFLIHPARFEAAGIVPAEAAAFGVPTITNNVGGLATTVADRVSGVVLP